MATATSNGRAPRRPVPPASGKPSTLPELLNSLRAFLSAYPHALSSPAPWITDSGELGAGSALPYRIPPHTVEAIRSVFAKNLESAAGRPCGVFVGPPGAGKTRALHELPVMLRAQLPAGHALSRISFTYDNHNAFSVADAVDLGPAASTAMRVLHAAACVPQLSFQGFLDDLDAQGVSAETMRDLKLSPSHVMPIIRERQCVPPDAPWVVLLCLDAFQKPARPFSDSRCPPSWDPAHFLASVVTSLASAATTTGAREAAGAPRTLAVPFLAGTARRFLESAAARGGPNPSLSLAYIPLGPLPPDACADVFDSSPALCGWWRTSAEFRRLADLGGSMPRDLESLCDDVAHVITRGGYQPPVIPPDAWAAVEGGMRRRRGLLPLPLHAELIGHAVLGPVASVARDQPLQAPVAADAFRRGLRTWGDLEEGGAVALVGGSGLESSLGGERQVVLPALDIGAMLGANTRLPVEVTQIEALLRAFRLSPWAAGTNHWAGLDWTHLESVIVWWEAIRAGLFLSTFPVDAPTRSLRSYFGHGKTGASGDESASVFSGLLRGPVHCWQPRVAAAPFPETRDLRDTVSGRSMQWDDGTMYRNAGGAAFGSFAVWRCDFGGAEEPVLVVGRYKLGMTTPDSALSRESVTAEHGEIKSQAAALGFPPNRWVLVMYTTDSRGVDPKELPQNVAVLGGGGGLESHLGPLLASTLRTVVRGRCANANLATVAELKMIDGLTAVAARAIVDARGTRGFGGWDDLVGRVGPALSPRARSRLLGLEDRVVF